MALDNYSDFQAAIADQLARTDLTSQIVDCITLFEAEAAFELFRQRRAETTTLLVPSNPGELTITNIANNGSGLARVTVSTATQSTTVTGTEIRISGTTTYDGSWIVTVIDNMDFDLQGSTFSQSVTTGNAQEPQGQAQLPSDYMGWRRVTWTGNPQGELEYVHPQVVAVGYPNSSPFAPLATPRVFTIEGNVLKIMPVDGTPIEFDYWAKTKALSTSLNWLFSNRPDCYWNGVLEQAYTYVKDYDQAAVFQTKKKANYSDIKMQLFREPGKLYIRAQTGWSGNTP